MQQQLSKQESKQAKTRRARQPKDPQISVARRNERERNRVKMVNNAFANLREHLPDELVERLVCDSKGKGKKFSKVETLRTAIQHIKNLVEVLNESSSSSAGDEFILDNTMYIQQQQQQQQQPISESTIVYASQQQFTPESPIYSSQQQQQLSPESPSVYSTQQMTPGSPVSSVYHSSQSPVQYSSQHHPASPVYIHHHHHQHQHQQQNTPNSPQKLVAETTASNWTYSQQHQCNSSSTSLAPPTTTTTAASTTTELTTITANNTLPISIKQEQVTTMHHLQQQQQQHQLNVHLNNQQAASPPTWFPSPASSTSATTPTPISINDQYNQSEQNVVMDAFVPLHHHAPYHQHHQISLYSQ